MRGLAIIDRLVDGQRGTLFLWAPVVLASGIGTYFSVRFEPDLMTLYVLGALTFGLLLWAIFWHRSAAVVLIGLSLWGAGVLLAAVRTHSVAAPQIEFRYYGPIQGRVVAIDRSVSDKPRLTLDRVVLRDTAPARTPGRAVAQCNMLPLPTAPQGPQGVENP